MIASAVENVDEIKANYNMGLITDTERYNQVIDVWTNTNAKFFTEMIMDRMKSDQGGFNSVFMMLDSGARGSKGTDSSVIRYERSNGKTTKKLVQLGRDYRKPDCS